MHQCVVDMVSIYAIGESTDADLIATLWFHAAVAQPFDREKRN